MEKLNEFRLNLGRILIIILTLLKNGGKILCLNKSNHLDMFLKMPILNF